MKNAKAKIAAGATVVLLGGLGGLALSQGNQAPSAQVADKPVVHTQVIRRTVHVTKHAKPKHPAAAAPLEPAAESAPVVSGSSGSSEPATITTSSSGSESAPVTTATSGGGSFESDDQGGEAEHESEGGDD